jgi:hypothetical protein
MEAQKINLNGENYLKESDVEKYYTRKDKVEVDKIVLEEALKKMKDQEFVTLVASIAEAKLKHQYVDLEDVMNPYHENFVLNKLMMIANANRL